MNFSLFHFSLFHFSFFIFHLKKAFLLISYGSPQCRGEVVPFLKNLLQGRPVSSVVLEKAATQYEELAHYTGEFSPLSRECRLLLERLKRRNLLQVPLYWGNLFWHPLLTDTLAEMSKQGVQRVAAFITSPFDSEISRNRYINSIENARRKIKIHLLPAFGNHPLYYRAVADQIITAGSVSNRLQSPQNRSLMLPAATFQDVTGTRILFTAHSLPLSDRGAERYVSQLSEAASGIVRLMQIPVPWELVFQSRSGKPSDPWLEPDILARIRQLTEERDRTGRPLSLLIVPVGFLLENKETVYDLDLQAVSLCEELRIPVVRVATAGSSPSVLEMIEQTMGYHFVPGFLEASRLSGELVIDKCPQTFHWENVSGAALGFGRGGDGENPGW